MERNMVGWFEIPVTDMERAKAFYAKVFGVEFESSEMGPSELAMFPGLEGKPGAAGALIKGEEYHKPSLDGVQVFFTAHSGDLSNELARVREAGGKVLKEKVSIGKYGFLAFFKDTEGNRLGLHSTK